jgi:hypothetical protein
VTIQCDQCHTRHDVDPPAWVVSSGKPFRFRCSACGHSQSVTPGSLLRDTPLPPALIDTPPPVEREIGPDEPTDPQAVRANAEEARRTPGSVEDGVFLKQNGQIYMVRDWQTLSRWIVEKRVDADDLVSEGGVRWEAIGARADLAPLFAAVHPAPPQTAFPFGGIDAGDVPWNDDDTEGVPTGLPPLPTEERSLGGQSPLPPALLDEESPLLERSDHSDPEPVPAVVDEDEEDTDDSDLVQPTPPTSRIREGPPPVAGPDGELSIDAPRASAPLDSLPSTPRDAWRDLLTHDDEETETQSVEAEVVSPLLPLTASPKPVSVPPAATALLPVPEPSPPVVEEEVDDEWLAALRRSRRGLWIGAAVCVVAAVAMAWIGWMRTPIPDTALLTTTPVIDAPASPVHVPIPVPDIAPAPTPAPVTKAAPTPKPTARPTPKPTPTPAPVTTAPKPVPAPAPAPAPASGESASALAKRGWDLADSAPTEAEKLFVKALSVEPTHDDANYGYGYLLLQRSKVVEAAPYLCRARRSKSADIRQDVNGLIASYGVACP